MMRIEADVLFANTVIVGTLETNPIFVANFVPSTLSYQVQTTSPLTYLAQVKTVFLPNQLSGPGIYPEAFDTLFSPLLGSTRPAYGEKTFKALINQPLIITEPGMCIRQVTYFNESFTDSFFSTGKVVMYEPGGAFAGTYENVATWSASGPNIGYDPQLCKEAAEENDPNAF